MTILIAHLTKWFFLKPIVWTLIVVTTLMTLFIISTVFGSTCRFFNQHPSTPKTWAKWLDFINEDGCNPFRWAEFWAYRI